MEVQNLKNKRGEIEFRKKLVQQQVEGELLFEDECSARDIEEILKKRMSKTYEQMTALDREGILLSPYIEIGAERCQRSLVMENDLGISGAAVDISYEMLQSCCYYSDVFDTPKRPLRICCDAYSLPFMSDSVPFIFCYETLHHFPDPLPVMEEVYRVLVPGGCFFLDEEPYKNLLHLDLYQQKRKHLEPLERENLMKRILRHFFGKQVYNEVEHGIIEKHDISIKDWRRALEGFESTELKLRTIMNMEADLNTQKYSLKALLAYLNGGEIRALCRKNGVIKKEMNDIAEVLICPSCREKGQESGLLRKGTALSCMRCGYEYPVAGEVLFLLAPQEMQQLYPEFIR
jgi:SAM-dependent methyltransferase